MILLNLTKIWLTLLYDFPGTTQQLTLAGEDSQSNPSPKTACIISKLAYFCLALVIKLKINCMIASAYFSAALNLGSIQFIAT